jgi:hypothetical protein
MRGGPSFDHLVRPQQQQRRDREAERLRGLEVHDQIELDRLLDRKIRKPDRLSFRTETSR